MMQTFRYKEYAENFAKKIKSAIKALDPFDEGDEKTGHNPSGYFIECKKVF